MKLRQKISAYKTGFIGWITNNVIAYFPSVHVRRCFLQIIGINAPHNVRFYDGFQIRKAQGIHIKEGTTIGPNVLLDGRKGLFIGRNVVIAYDSIIWTLNHDYNDMYFSTKGAPVYIEDFVWVCSRAIILPGVTIGEGAIVASNAIVTKDVPPYSIVAGIPARVVGMREKKKYSYGYKSNEDYSHFI